MKITGGQLRQIIREELGRSLAESEVPVPYYPPGDPRGEPRQTMQPKQSAPVDPRFTASLEAYEILLRLLTALKGKSIAVVRSSGALQSGELLAYDPRIKVLWIKWQEQGRPAMKWTYISDPDFLSRNSKQVRPILDQLNSLDFPAFDEVAPGAFVSYIDDGGVRFNFPGREKPLVFGSFRDGIEMSSVPDASLPGFISRSGLTKVVRFDSM